MKKDKDFKELNMYTWGVRSLYRPGALHILMDILDKYKADLIALPKVRWTSSNILKKRYNIC